jgi:hypothetical protein
MGILKSAADLLYTIRFLKLLVTPFEDTDAYKSGIINKDGSRNKDFDKNTIDTRNDYANHYTPFHRLVFNIKRIMAKAPGGQSAIARYGAALMLIKEHGELNDDQLMKIHDKTGIDILDVLAEETQWFMLEDKQLSPGIYRMKNESITRNTYAEVVKKGDQIRIVDAMNTPVDEILGIDIYEAVHLNSKQKIYVTTSEITR